MLDVKVFSQRDPKWRNNQHGTSNSTIGETGCTISVIASMLVHAGYDTDPARLNKLLTDNDGYAQGNLVVWTVIPKLFPKVKWVYRYYEYKNDLAREWIKEKGILPIVQVGAAPIGGAPGGKHWVGFVGDMKSIDPWTGTIKDTSTWEPSGMALYEYTPKGQDMSECLVPNTPENRETYDKIVGNSGKADALAKYLGLGDKADNVSSDSMIKSIAARVGNADALRSDVAKWKTEAENRVEQVSRLEQQLSDKDKLYKDLLTGQNNAQTIYEEKERTLLGHIEQLESKVDAASKEKGRMAIDLAETKTKLEACQRGSGQVPTSAIVQVINWIKSLWNQSHTN